MIYPYSQTNRLEEPHNYMYTEFQGAALLEAYLSSRIEIANRCDTTEEGSAQSDQILVVNALSKLEYLFGATSPNADKQFLKVIESGRSKATSQIRTKTSCMNSRAKDLGEMTIDEPVTTLELLQTLVSVQLTDIQNPNIKVWLDRLVQRFEVTKKLYGSYLVGFRTGEGKTTSVRLYWLFALALCLIYAHTQGLKYLNTLLKVSDLLCSLPENILREQIPVYGLLVVLASEVVSIQLLAEKSGGRGCI